MSRLVLFSDLDGSLLDSETYEFEAASDALRELSLRSVPLVLCTSKTKAECAPLRRRLKNRHPFIVENGAGIVIPPGYFGPGTPRRIDLGRRYSEVSKALEELARGAGVRVRGFRRFSARQVSEKTGLTLEEARRAKRREYDEPFVFLEGSEEARARLRRLARRRGFDLARGGRFWHLFAGSDKGVAVRRLTELYGRRGPCRTAAVGDAANDLPMLRAVDRAILLPGSGGRFDRAVLRGLPGVVRGSAPGPEGWNEAVLRLLAQRAR